ncbi:hypothetical protein [Chroococcidiopsis sp. CCMEE 29]|uniref:hypothetical protein n=1 Tax=Chroococcidiopsis sp. CCMEE 29 TaxID=155894 RepID=UPI002020245A|nr:hypothetical protein [Chroococcidiopsis sp. CCMEE 29]
MNIIQATLFIAYLLITFYFLLNWFNFFSWKNISSPEENFLSLLILMITLISWPFLVPISAVQALKAKKLQLSNVIPIILMIFITISGLAAFAGTIL